MGVLLARDWAIAKNFTDENGQPWSVQRDGIPAEAMRNIKVICSENAHFSVQKNMAMMGMGFQSVVTVPVNELAQMDVDALENHGAFASRRQNRGVCGGNSRHN